MTTRNEQLTRAARTLGACCGMLLMLFAVSGVAVAQSEDRDNPTPVAANIVEGEGDGKATTYYYSFTAGPGDVKLTVDGKTDNYSSPLRVKLSDEDGKELLDVSVVANKPPKREVAQRRFVRQQKVIMSVSMIDDAQVKLMSFKIKLDGAVTFEDVPSSVGSPAGAAAPTVEQPVATPADPSAAAPVDVPQTPTEQTEAVASAAASAKGGNKKLGLSILNALGERLNLPSDGTLRIEMKDGAVQEFDLTKVKKILVKQ